jgi:small-conductance mechanosensitive channel
MSIVQAIVLGSMTPCAFAQDTKENRAATAASSVPGESELAPAPAKVDIKPLARDEEIVQRLRAVLIATEWFTDPEVRVEEGVVFLSGRVGSVELKKWASDLARNTQDVVAVANRMEVTEPPVWDFSPAAEGMTKLWRDFVRTLPLFVFGLLILALSIGAGSIVTRVMRMFLRTRIRARLLLNVLSGMAGLITFLFGIYVILRVAGLTQLALSVIGGTGLVGLALGIAFRDITENFLASIFLSLQRPFEKGDLVEVSGMTGYVQQLNIRTTILMTLDGNLVQIPNASVYKSNIRNFTVNPNRREDFIVGIGYDASISEAQEIARTVLADHPAILNDPEPMVLADSMGTSTINLRIYFWLNGHEHSWLKVRSSVIRLTKVAFQKNGVSMPDEAREIVFPSGVPVMLLNRESSETRIPAMNRPDLRESLSDEPDTVSTNAETGLSSEAGVIEEQARHVGPLKAGENLLRATANEPATANRTTGPE